MEPGQHVEHGARLERWLADLDQALEQAQRLTSLLGLARGRSAETRELYSRLELARSEIEHLRRAGAAYTDQPPPDWINSMLKSAGAVGLAD